MRTSPQQQWVQELPGTAAGLAQRWTLRQAGEAWSGWWSAVWPVVDASGQRLALKISTPGDGREHEAAALRAWGGRGTVRLIEDDPESNALLLERLHGTHTLESHPDIDEATAIIADLLARLGGRAPFPGLRTPVRLAAAMTADIDRHAATGLLSHAQIARARETLIWFGNLPAERWRLVHGDCHFSNVLRLDVLPSVSGQPRAWAAIDPLPFAGVPEAEPVAMLRNRFADAAATGDPDRHLRRRVDVIADRTGMDAGLVRRFSQAVAVQNLSYLLAEHPKHQFVGPYEIIAGW